MIRNMVTATNTMGQLQKQLDMIANNIGNVNTFGYKQDATTFSALLTQEMQNQRGDTAPRDTPLGIRTGVGAKIAQSQLMMEQGAFQRTDRELDFAFQEPNQFFKVLVENDNGEAEVNYTRNGALYVTPINDDEVMLVDGNGNPVLDPADNPITFAGGQQEIQLDANGQLSIIYPDAPTELIDLGVVDIQRPQLMERVSTDYLGIPDNLAELNVTPEEVLVQLEGAGRDAINLEQGVLEQSNVDLSKAFTDMISVQRNYQFHSRAISISDQMMGLVNGMR